MIYNELHLGVIEDAIDVVHEEFGVTLIHKVHPSFFNGDVTLKPCLGVSSHLLEAANALEFWIAVYLIGPEADAVDPFELRTVIKRLHRQRMQHVARITRRETESIWYWPGITVIGGDS